MNLSSSLFSFVASVAEWYRNGSMDEDIPEFVREFWRNEGMM